MTIANEVNKSGPYFYNGAATSFGYGFKIDDATHIRVVETVVATGTETDLVLNTDYTVTGVGNDTGSVVISPARAAGKSVVLVRDVPFTQPIVLENQGAYFAKVVEAALDRGVARDQQLAETISRAVVVPVSSDGTDIETLIGGIVALLGNVDDVVTVADNITVIASVPTLAAQAVANVALTHADVVLTHADVVLTHADVVLTHADRVQTGIDAAAAALAASSLDVANLRWLAKAIGEYYAVDDSMAGADIPPTNNAGFRYIKLTAADAYNGAFLTSESVSGSAPAVLATAVVNSAGSPLDGKTVRLINTERRLIRAGAAGTVEADALQNITGSFSNVMGNANVGTGAFGAATSLVAAVASTATPAYTQRTLNFDASLAVRTANETRGKNLGVTYYMRIK